MHNTYSNNASLVRLSLECYYLGLRPIERLARQLGLSTQVTMAHQYGLCQKFLANITFSKHLCNLHLLIFCMTTHDAWALGVWSKTQSLASKAIVFFFLKFSRSLLTKLKLRITLCYAFFFFFFWCRLLPYVLSKNSCARTTNKKVH